MMIKNSTFFVDAILIHVYSVAMVNKCVVGSVFKPSLALKR